VRDEGGTTTRPWLGYWPDPADEQDLEVHREPVTLVAPDGAVVRGILWTPPSGRWRVGVLLAHPRGDFSTHYACAPLAAAGYGVLGIATRSVNDDTDLLHEGCVVDVVTAGEELRRRGAEALVALGNCGGGSLMALAQAGLEAVGAQGGRWTPAPLGADGFIATAAHPGEGEYMAQVIDPSVTDEGDRFSVDPELDMYHPDNGWRPWPEPSRYDPVWLDRYRAAQRERVARIDEVARASVAAREVARQELRDARPGTAAWSELRRRSVSVSYLTVYRTLADPAHLDPSIDPDDRPLGSILAVGDPLVANYGARGLARTVSDRAWLSTWSALSSHARMADTMPHVEVPTLIVHPTADTEVRMRQAVALRDAAGADDVTFELLRGAPHYLEGHRREANELVVDWIRARFG